MVFPDLVQGRVVEWAEPEHSLGWDQGLGRCGCNKVACTAAGGQHCFPGAVWVSDNNGHHLPSWTTSQATSVSLDKVFSQDLVTLDTLLSCVWSEKGKGFCPAQTGECREAATTRADSLCPAFRQASICTPSEESLGFPTFLSVALVFSSAKGACLLCVGPQA